VSIVSDQLHDEVMDNPPFSRVTLWLEGGHVLRGSMHVPGMPAGKAYAFPLTMAAEDLHVMVNPESIVAYAVWR